MNEATRQRLFGYERAFEHPVTLWITAAVAAGLVVTGVLIPLLKRRNLVSDDHYRELYSRWKSWCLLVLLMFAPILLGAGWTIPAVTLLSLLCYREFARATGLFRERLLSATVVAGIFLLMFASLDHYPRLFFASASIMVAFIAMVSIHQDRPQGYIQRVALATLGFLLFGLSLGYLGYFANDDRYRQILLLILVAVETNDIFAYCVGKSLGGPKLLPNTSPGKTVSGAAGALVLTTLLTAGIGHFVFKGTPMDRADHLLTLGVMISGLGQLGDLMLSSIKRDVGVKDLGVAIPGHGGFLDRFDSLVLVPPAVFHYLSLHLGPLGGDAALQRIITGG